MRMTLVVDAGRVRCPRGGDVSVDTCWSCRDLLRVDDAAGGTITCDAVTNGDLRLLARW